MDTRTGDIYDSREQALAAGVPDEFLVTGTRKQLITLREYIKPTSRYVPHQGNRERARRTRQLLTIKG